MEDIGIAPSARARQKPVILREGKAGVRNPSFYRQGVKSCRLLVYMYTRKVYTLLVVHGKNDFCNLYL